MITNKSGMGVFFRTLLSLEKDYNETFLPGYRR